MTVEKVLADKVALITGGARNMGRAFCSALSNMGADVVIHHHSERSAAQAEEAAALVHANGRRAHVVVGDLARPNVVREVFDSAQSVFSRLDIVINNAGLVIKKPLVEVSEEEFDRSFGINAKAAFFVMQEAARRLENGGRIINMGTTILGATIPQLFSVRGRQSATRSIHARARKGDWRPWHHGERRCARPDRHAVLSWRRNSGFSRTSDDGERRRPTRSRG